MGIWDVGPEGLPLQAPTVGPSRGAGLTLATVRNCSRFSSVSRRPHGAIHESFGEGVVGSAIGVGMKACRERIRAGRAGSGQSIASATRAYELTNGLHLFVLERWTPLPPVNPLLAVLSRNLIRL